MRKLQKEINNYKNNRGLFWELENRIMGRKKEYSVLRPTQDIVAVMGFSGFGEDSAGRAKPAYES